MDCGNKIHKKTALNGSGLCHPCAVLGSRNPAFIDGKRGVKKDGYYCIEGCGNKIYRCGGRCKSCAMKKKMNDFWSSKEGQKKKEEFSIKFSGEGNPNFRDGLSKIYYTKDFTSELKWQIRVRDQFKCRVCKLTEEESLLRWGMTLCIHHLDYDKQNCDKRNLLATCNSCNAKLNANREKNQVIYSPYANWSDYSYYLEDKYWEIFKIKELDRIKKFNSGLRQIYKTRKLVEKNE